MKVLGIDPGTRHLGWGIVEKIGTRVAHVAHGVIDTDESAPMAPRLVQIERELQEVIETYRPDAGAIEQLFFGKDATAAAKLGHARGVAMLVLARAGMAPAEYEPSRVKRALVGTGRAEKKQVALVVTAHLRLTAVPRPDAADALAVAILHANVAAVESRMALLQAAQAKAFAARKRVRPR